VNTVRAFQPAFGGIEEGFLSDGKTSTPEMGSLHKCDTFFSDPQSFLQKHLDRKLGRSRWLKPHLWRCWAAPFDFVQQKLKNEVVPYL